MSHDVLSRKLKSVASFDLKASRRAGVLRMWRARPCGSTSGPGEEAAARDVSKEVRNELIIEMNDQNEIRGGRPRSRRFAWPHRSWSCEGMGHVMGGCLAQMQVHRQEAQPTQGMRALKPRLCVRIQACMPLYLSGGALHFPPTAAWDTFKVSVP